MTLDERVALLERGQRLWRGVAIAAMAVASAAVVALAGDRMTARHLRVSALEVVDSEGNTVASLASESTGPALRMHAAGLNADLALGASRDVIGLIVLANDQPRMSLMLAKDGFPALSLSDQHGRTRLLAAVGVEGSESPLLQLRDQEGRTRIYAHVAAEPVLVVRDVSGTPVFRAPPEPVGQ